MTPMIWRTLAAMAAICGAVQAVPAQTPAAAPAQAATGERKSIDARPWPRTYEIDGTSFLIFRPQIDSWNGHLLKARAVMAVETGETKGKDGKTVTERAYGVLWLSARTETDKDAREIILDDVAAEKVNFPNAKAKEATWLAMARKVLPTTDLVASLDSVEAALAIGGALADASDTAVNNGPPEIIVSLVPAALVLIDGDPAWRPAGVAGVDYVLNSRATILRYKNALYLGRAGKWVSASALNANWASTATVPAPVSQALTRIMAARDSAQQSATPPDAAATKIPVIYVRTRPAELIVVDGEPSFDAIEGTSLQYVANTPADMFLDSGNNWYVLVSGRWFTAASTKGPWAYVAPNRLPADFLKIPSDGPKGAVLASIAGTPEAKEALVANSVPQTATVSRTAAAFNAIYDGAPQFAPVEGTTLAAAKNSPTPIFRIDSGTYMALDKGVWFASSGATGPWTVATTVPAVIYTIPASSALHYVTYVRVYGSTPAEVYVGYTPGYYGTVASDGVVVYGTGYSCNAWIGTSAYYSCPVTYGYGAVTTYTVESGWAMSFGYAYYDPWYYPYWGPWYYPPYYYGGAGYAYGNVYGHWGSSVVAGTGAAWANSWTGNYGQGYRGGYYNTATGGRGYGYAGANTNIYTGNTTRAAGGVRYNPETGRVVAGQGGSINNAYTGNGAAGGTRTTVNTNTGRVTNSAGGATRTGQGATAGGAFNSKGANGDVAGAGGVHYDRATGDISKGGVIEHDGNVYAGKDGNVYHYDKADGWSQVKGDGPQPATRDKNLSGKTYGPELDRDRAARERGNERDMMGGRDFSSQRMDRPSFDRGAYGGGFSGRMGGFRGGRGRR